MKVLLIDIETRPALAYIWDLRTEYVSPDKIISPGATMCWSAKWLDSPTVYFSAEWDGGNKAMVRKIHAMMDEADVIVHYNGLKFDIPTLNREFLELGLSPPSPSKHIDLYQIVKHNFKFLSNKLDYVAKRLGLSGKVEHKGMELWTGCMAGNKADQATMKKYNKRDVTLLEEVYYKLRPWIKNHPNPKVVDGLDGRRCAKCGSKKVQQRGYNVTPTLKYPRFHCQECGGWSQGSKAVAKKDPDTLRSL